MDTDKYNTQEYFEYLYMKEWIKGVELQMEIAELVDRLNQIQLENTRLLLCKHCATNL